MSSNQVEEFIQPLAIEENGKYIYWILSTLIFVENIFLVTVILLKRKLRTPTNLIIASLSTSDLFNGCILLPCILLLGLSHPFVQPLLMLVLLSSIFNITGLCVERWLAIHFALQYRSIVTKRRCMVFIGIIWFASLLTSVIPKIAGEKMEHSLEFRQVFLGIITSIIFLMLLALFAIYADVYRVTRKHRKAILAQQNYFLKRKECRKYKLKSIKTEFARSKKFAMTTLTFSTCWLPLVYINFVGDVLNQPGFIPPHMLEVSLYTIFISSIINPIIYGYWQKSIRKTMLKIIKTSHRYKSIKKEKCKVIIELSTMV